MSPEKLLAKFYYVKFVLKRNSFSEMCPEIVNTS